MVDTLDRLKAALSDRYGIERELGAGGMATVYLAEDLKHHRKVAVKVLRPDLASALGPERFLQEIEIAAQLQHPNILALYDSGEADGFLFYVMPYVEGPSLRDKFAKEGELPIGDAVRILRDVVDALTEAHAHGVVHRDIKPENILLRGRHALVTDFGVAKAVSEATGREKLTTAGVALGTPAYMAPEQASADPHLDQRVDIYAVGAVAYELLTGRPVFMGTTPQMILSAHMTEPPQPVTKHRDTVPVALESVVMRCLEKRPADRWQSAEELLPQLEALATPSGGVTPTGITPIRGVKKPRWMMAGAAVGIAAVIAVIAVITGLPRGGGVALGPNRVVVAELRNGTGDPTLDQVGGMAGHWITQGLQQTQVLQVVPWEMAFQASRFVHSEANAGQVVDPIRGLAEETGAGIVISGAYYLEGDSIQIQVDVNDAVEGTLVGSIDPLRGSRNSLRDVLARLQQRVMGFLAVRIDDRLAAPVDMAGDPPSFEAFQAYSQGLDEYLQVAYARALPHFRRAVELDPNWPEALWFLALAHASMGEWAQADSLLHLMEGIGSGLTPYWRAYMEWAQAWVDGDHERALEAVRRAAQMAPGSRAVYNLAYQYKATNRPREAVETFRTLDPERGAMRGWVGYWVDLVDAICMLGEHEEELAAATRAFELHPDFAPFLYFKGRALAALGRLGELSAVVDELVDQNSVWAGDYMSEFAEVLEVHGYADEAKSFLERSIEWFENRPPEEAATLYHRRALGWTQSDLGHRVEARQTFDALVEQYPDDVWSRGLRGLVAATTGDSTQVMEDLEWLEHPQDPYQRGLNTFWRAVINSALGRLDGAVDLLWQAYGEGRDYSSLFSYASWFAPLRDHPGFQEFLRPKG